MTLSPAAQNHLLTAFQAHIVGDDVIPTETRYRMYAEKVVRHPLREWQGLTVEEARTVFKRLASEPLLTTQAPTSSEPPPWIALPEEVEHDEDETDAAPLLALVSVSRLNPYPQPDPGVQLRLPDLFCPGRAVVALPPSPEPGRLYGLPVGQDWVTVRAEGKESLTYSWASRRTSQDGQGSRSQFDAWLLGLAAGSAA